jgi:transcriptional regulator with XRE-family HTH domain
VHSIAFIIKELRKRKKMSQGQLGEYVGVSQQQVGKWESDRGTPTTQQLPVVCKVLGITVEQMLAGELPESDDSSEQQLPIVASTGRGKTEVGLAVLERLQYELRIKELELEKEQMASQLKSEIIHLKDQEIERQRKEIERQRSQRPNQDAVDK